jgi:hypothetical protein
MILVVLKYSRPLPTPEETMHNFLEEESTASPTRELGDEFMASACSLNRVACEPEETGLVDVVIAAEALYTVDMQDTGDAVEGEKDTNVCAPVAKLKVTIQIPTEIRIAHVQEETAICALDHSVSSKETSKSIVSPTHV